MVARNSNNLIQKIARLKSSLCCRPKLIPDLVQESNSRARHKDSKDASTSKLFFFHFLFFLALFSIFLGCGFFCTFAFYSFFSTREPKLLQYITTQPVNKLHSTGEEQLEDFMQQDRLNYAAQTQGYRQSKASSTECRVTGQT